MNLASPTAKISGLVTGTVGTALTFSGTTSTAPAGQTLTYSWNFGDGATATGPIASHIYTAVGSFPVALTVTASDSITSTANTVATITAAPQPSKTHGTVFGGQQPVSGATVQLWQVGTTGYGSGATPLGAPATTTSGGNFTLTGGFSCPPGPNGNNTLVYITATGGNPGIPTPTNNTALALMAALGTCGSLTPSSYVSINELTTVASVYALAQFMSPSGNIGSYASSTQGLINAFANVNNLVNVGNGRVLSLTPNGNGIVPSSEINTLADVIATCVNTSGPSSNECTSLFSLTTPPSGTAPTNTIAAALSIALNPSQNVSKILYLATPASPYQPTLTATNDWTMAIGFASGGSAPANLAVDSLGNVWIANYGAGGASSTVSMLSPLGVPATNSPFAGTSSINGANAVAIDMANNAWIVNHDNNSAAELSATYVGTGYTVAVANGPFANIGLNAPSGIAIDGANDIWFVNNGSNSLSELFNNNYNGNNGSYTNLSLNAPGAIAFDNANNLWVANTAGSSVVKVNAQATALIPAVFSGGGLISPAGIAIDGQSNVWATDASLGQVSEIASSGTPVSPSSGYTGGGLTGATADAIDGSGNVWVADASGNRLSELSSAGVAISSATGFQGGSLAAPASLAIDGSGDVWVANVNPATVNGLAITATEFIGAAAPTVTPLALAVKQAQLGTRPGTPLAPIVTAGGPYTGNAYQAINFSAVGSYDPANLSAGSLGLSYTWTFGDGGTASGVAPIYAYAAAGTYTVTVTATNTAGVSASASTTAVIGAGTAPVGAPIANPGGPYTGNAGAGITFNGSGSSDPNGLALTYLWMFGDGGTSAGANPTHTYAGGGTYSVTLTVGNGTSQSSAGTTATIASPATSPLSASAGGPYTVAVNQPVTLNGSQSYSPTGRQLTYVWSFGDGTSGTGSNPTHIYTASGSYTINLTVSDGTGAAAAATAQVTVSGPAAEAITAVAGGPYQDVTGHAIIFNASSSSDNLGNAITYAWNFGDGQTGTGATPSHAYAAKGAYTATVTVSSASASATASAAVTISPAIQVSITSPTANALFSSNTITVSGTTSGPGLTISVNGTPAQVSGSTFTASGVSLREGVNLISATATDGNGGSGTGVVSVILDATAPTASITSPANGSVLTSSNIAVTGLVNDIVTGTIGSNNVTVTVNGLPAQVNNRSYMLPSLQLVPGANTITVVTTDNVGNSSKTTATVQVLPANSQLSLAKIGGDAQTATVRTVLPQPLVVQLVSAAGSPVAGRPITFTVTRSDGMVEVMPTIAQTVTVATDANGKASALFQLGSRSGLGVNQVSASTPGAAAPAVFSENSTIGAASQIHVVNGDNQRGLLGQSLAQAMQVIVQDATGNPVPGVTVNYTSIGASDGSIDNASPVTDANGKAIANLTLGQQEGMENYKVTADFAGDTGGPVTFNASAFAPGPVSATSVSGVVLDSSNSPVQNATVTLQGTGLSTTTSANGTFTLSGAPVGTVTLTVDGSTATSTQTLPFLSFVLQDLPGQNNTLGKPIYLPFIDVNDAQTVGSSEAVTLTMAGVPGVAFTVAPNSVTFPDGSTVGKLSLSQVKSDMVPMEPTNGTGPDLIWTLQPAGTRFSVPIQVTLPNTQGLPPGTVSEMYQYDHDLEQFVSVGTGHVSADGSVIVSDPGFGITKAGWGHGPVLQVPGACSFSCNPSTECMNIARSQTSCNCIETPYTGKACGAPLAMDANGNYLTCQLRGQCTSSGTCGGPTVPAGLPCTPKPHFCDTGGVCNGGGSCVSAGTIDDQVSKTANGGAGDSLTATQSLFSTFGYAQKFLEKLGLNYITVTPSLGVSTQQETYHCCEQTQTLNTLVTENSFNPSLTISGVPLPVIIGGVPFGWPLPGHQVLGLNVSAQGTLALSFVHRQDTCQNKDCRIFKFNPQFQLQFGVNVPAGYISAGVSVTGGIQLEVNGGCNTFTAQVSSLPIVATGYVQIFNGTSFATNLSFNHVLVNSIVSPLAFTYTAPSQ